MLALGGWLTAFLTVDAQAAVVENLRHYRAPDHTRLVFELSEAVDHKVFILENPHRIVVDIENSRLNTDFSAKRFPDTPIRQLRSAPRQEKDLRVVLDLNAKVQARSFLLEANEQYGQRLVLDLFDDVSEKAARTQPVVKSNTPDNGRRDIIIAINAGHGGEDPGAIGVNGLQEKQVTLPLAREVYRLLDAAPGYKPLLIRQGDYDIDLRKRINKAHDQNADFYIAIHADAFTSAKPRGATVYALSQRGATSEHARRVAAKENSADLIGGVGKVSISDKDEVLASVLLDLSMTATIASSLEAGEKIIASLSDVVRMRRKNVEQAAFVELKSADIPSLLIESGYITNPTDARNLNSPAFRKKFARAVVNGITAYFTDTPPRGSYVAWLKENGAAPTTYVVSRGDSLSEIAARFKISIGELRTRNNLSSNTIRIGQKLSIPPAFPGATANIEHTISRGETLSGIAGAYSVSTESLRKHNRLNGDTIRVGQILKIPST